MENEKNEWTARVVNGDSIEESIKKLNEETLAYFLALIQFHQRINKMFFSEENYTKFDKELDETINAFLKIKKENRTKSDLETVLKALTKAIDKYGSLKGKSILPEVAIKLFSYVTVRDVSNWIFQLNELYNNSYEIYDWMV